MIHYTKEYISRLLDRFMAGESTLEEEDLLSEYFRRGDVPEEWRDYQTLFAEWSQPAEQPARRPVWRWAVAAAVVAGVAVFVVTPSRHAGQPDGPVVAQTAVSPPADTIAAPADTAVAPALRPDTVATPASRPAAKPKQRRRMPRINDDVRRYALLAQMQQEEERVRQEVQRCHEEAAIAQMAVQGYRPIRLDGGTLEFIPQDEESEYYAYEED